MVLTIALNSAILESKIPTRKRTYQADGHDDFAEHHLFQRDLAYQEKSHPHSI
jgi:hypothetical protein